MAAGAGSLCQSFPTRFDLIDATADGKVHGVAKADCATVVDQCYLCDLCYMTKCPCAADRIPDPHERKRELARLIGVEDRMCVEVEGQPRSDAIADENMERENAEKTSAVHFLRFEFPKTARDAVRAGAAVKLGCDHTNYPAHVVIAADTVASLAGDLS